MKDLGVTIGIAVLSSIIAVYGITTTQAAYQQDKTQALYERITRMESRLENIVDAVQQLRKELEGERQRTYNERNGIPNQ